jgi:hypothetical protein
MRKTKQNRGISKMTQHCNLATVQLAFTNSIKISPLYFDEHASTTSVIINKGVLLISPHPQRQIDPY